MNPFPKNPSSLQEESLQEQQLLEFLKSNPQVMKKYQEQVTKMQSKSKTAKQQQPMTSKQYDEHIKNSTIQQYLDEEGGIVILPDKGFVIKFFDKKSGEKIFVNILKHSAVDHPEEKILIDLENQSGLRIPMSMGRVREDNDKKGVPCKTVDVVMNTKIVETAQKTADIFYFMAQIIANYLLEKHKIMVVEEQVVKVNLKYKGNNVEIQRIKAKKSPKIEEIPSKSKMQEETEERVLSGLSEHASQKLRQPQFKIFGVSFEGEKEEYSLQSKGKVKLLEIQFDLSLLIHSRGIHLQGNRRTLYLSVKGLYEICLRLPENIESFRAKFGRKERMLRVNCVVQELARQEHKKETLEGKKLGIKIQSSLLDQLV